MPHLFRTIKRKDPKNEMTVKYYGLKVYQGKTEMNEISTDYSQTAGQSEGTCLGLMQDIMTAAVKYLLQGYSVQLGEIGTFRLSANGLGSDTEEEYEATRITKIKIVFTPSTHLKKAVALDNKSIEFKQLK